MNSDILLVERLVLDTEDILSTYERALRRFPNSEDLRNPFHPGSNPWGEEKSSEDKKLVAQFRLRLAEVCDRLRRYYARSGGGLEVESLYPLTQLGAGSATARAARPSRYFRQPSSALDVKVLEAYNADEVIHALRQQLTELRSELQRLNLGTSSELAGASASLAVRTGTSPPVLSGPLGSALHQVESLQPAGHSLQPSSSPHAGDPNQWDLATEEILSRLPELLKRTRTARGHDQADAAAELGHSVEHYRKIEQGSRRPGRSSSKRYVEYVKSGRSTD